ncbi:unnamed protein product [Aureobasidium pullulans]|nr:unnamed protein product [Aureobasidium pullulans]
MASTSHAFFTSIPWTSRLLASPSVRTAHPFSRTPKPLTGEDSLIAGTLATSSTIPHCLIYYPRPCSADAEVNAINVLLKVEDGCNGYPSILHGGITATIIDEAMGMLLQLQSERLHLGRVATGHASGEIASGVKAFTKSLNVEFKSPIKTPGIILVKVKVVERKGRGIKMVATVGQKVGQEEELDGEVKVCATGEAIYVTPRGSKL